MKKATYIYGLTALAATLTLTSCEDMFGDFLDKQASNELTEADVFGDWANVEQFHYDTYNFLRHGAARIGESWLDAATDLAETSFAKGGTRTTFNIGNYYGGGDELEGSWESRYRGIRKCNMIINRMANVPRALDISTEKFTADTARVVAESRFFRAYFYWELFLRYGAVPIVTEVLDPDGDLLTGYTERPTLKAFVVDFILNELKNCEANLYTYEDAWSKNNAGRVSQPAARALRSRIMLYMASPRYAAESGITWAQAAEVTKSFIDDFGANFSLMTDGADGLPAYTNAWLRTTYTGENKEIIFFRNDGTIGWGNINVDTPVGEGGRGGNCPSQNLVDMYDMADGSAPFTEYDATGAPVYDANGNPTINTASGYTDANMWENRDGRLAATVLWHGRVWGQATDTKTNVLNMIIGQRDNPIGNANATPTGYYMSKYIPETILSSNHGGTAYRLWIISRYAEILLNYAEALNEVDGPTSEVCELLDEIRHRAGITGNVIDRADLKTKEAMRNFIHKERTIELAYEEHRAWDVRRWGVATEALSRPIYGVEIDAQGVPTRKVAQKRVFEDKMYLYPIPEGEVWKTSIKNNPGW
ncbi:MAG: RagB/SusD family nutrient uptake outer membrane protein [Bacteroidales bacterium]|nr:RagB/SusD family nutrient uptake outer membrane protein [Bacteroidales bacterium]